MIVGAQGDDPRLHRELGQEIAAVKAQGLFIAGKAFSPILRLHSGAAQGFKLLRVQHHIHLVIPAVGAVTVDDPIVSRRRGKTVEHGAHAVEHGLQLAAGVSRLLAACALQQREILLLRSGALAVMHHIGQQQPHLPHTVGAVIHRFSLEADREATQHLHMHLLHSLSLPLVKFLLYCYCTALFSTFQ